MNVRVAFYLPEIFPDHHLITGIALISDGRHFVIIEVADPLDLSPSCMVGPQGEPCSADGALHVTVDGQDVLQRPGTFRFDGEIDITAANLLLECQRFSKNRMWVEMPKAQKLMCPESRTLRRTTISLTDWLLVDSMMIAPPWCEKYLKELDGDLSQLTQHHSQHAVFRVGTPDLSTRVNVGMNSAVEQVVPGGGIVPASSFWQMDVRVENFVGGRLAKGMLGETAWAVLDESGKPIMSGLGVLRGAVEDYRVVNPLGTEFKQLFVPESGGQEYVP